MTLTRDQVEETALGILTRFGLADLSMRRLARELHVQVGALYWHVKNKQELLVAVAGRLLDGLEVATVPADPESARDMVAELASALRAALAPVPDSAEVFQVAQSLRPGALEPLNRLRSLLEAAGVAPERSGWAQHLVVNHILGSVAATQETSRLAAVDPDAAPSPLGEEAFTWGLDVVLDGLLGARAVCGHSADGP
jgi:TetR/AcrR family transcriptional regulator, tetracycline repressor protein